MAHGQCQLVHLKEKILILHVETFLTRQRRREHYEKMQQQEEQARRQRQAAAGGDERMLVPQRSLTYEVRSKYYFDDIMLHNFAVNTACMLCLA